jgi:Arc/MetJ-type ribon-helix-helix transcriptional regulator
MQITLPPEAQAIVDREIESGRYASVEEVIIDALFQLDFDPDSTYLPDEYLVTAREQVARGETVPVTDDLRRRILQDAAAAHARGDEISDDVVY